MRTHLQTLFINRSPMDFFLRLTRFLIRSLVHKSTIFSTRTNQNKIHSSLNMNSPAIKVSLSRNLHLQVPIRGQKPPQLSVSCQTPCCSPIVLPSETSNQQHQSCLKTTQRRFSASTATPCSSPQCVSYGSWPVVEEEEREKLETPLAVLINDQHFTSRARSIVVLENCGTT